MTRQQRLLALALVAGAMGSATYPPGRRPSAAPARDASRDVTLRSTSAAGEARLAERYGELPLSFTANHGETDGQVRFLSRGAGYSLFLANSEAVLRLDGPSSPRPSRSGGSRRGERGAAAADRGAVLRMKLVGANMDPEAIGLDEMPGKSHYFLGDDPRQWRTNVPTYGKVRFANVYPGIDLVYYGNHRQLEYDFVVAPGADPSAILLGLTGADRLQIQGSGELSVYTRAGEVRWHKPVIYQESKGQRQTVTGRYTRRGDDAVGFEIGDYDRARELVIDPVLTYSTYLGGTKAEFPYGIAVDAAGSAYIAGYTQSIDFPTNAPIQGAFGGGINGYDVFVSKLNAAGNAVVYSTYLGGAGIDEATAIAVDPAGNAYITGDTSSATFPKVNAFQATLRGSGNAFITKLNAAGSALLYSTYFGGSASLELGYGIAVNAAGHAFVVGSTDAANFPTKNAFRPTYGGNSDAFVARLDTTLSGNASLVYSTYLGGANFETGRAIAVDAAGNAYVTGTTLSANFPISAGAFQGTLSGGGDAFVAKLNPAGSALVYSTYLGGSSALEGGEGIAVDSSGVAYIVGATPSTNFPTLNGYQATFGDAAGF